MNRRGFLTTLFQTAGGIIVAPSIVTHGLKLKPFKPSMVWEGDLMMHKMEMQAMNFDASFYTMFFHKSPWTALIKEGKFPSNLGQVTRSV